MIAGGKSAATILVVDDSPIIADTVAQILTMYGYKALTAYCAESALKIALKTAPTLVLTDVMLPGMHDIELAIIMEEALPDCKIVLFSGQAGTAHLLDDAKLRGHEFPILAKPVHQHELLDHLKMRLSDDGAQTLSVMIHQILVAAMDAFRSVKVRFACSRSNGPEALGQIESMVPSSLNRWPKLSIGGIVCPLLLSIVDSNELNTISIAHPSRTFQRTILNR